MNGSSKRRVRLPVDVGSERRANPRFAARLDVRYKIVGGGPVQAGHGHTINLSSSGLYFNADRPLSVGQKIEAAVDWPAQLHGHIPLQLIVFGVVVRTDGTATALKFWEHEFKTRRAAPESA